MSAVPLSVQLLLTFVGLLMGITFVLTTAAYSSLVTNLEAEAMRNVSLAAEAREQTLTQLFHLRQQRAEGFLRSVQSFCGEPLPSGRLAWAGDCVRTMVDDFRTGERALGALLTHGSRRIGRSGKPFAAEAPDPGALARVIHGPDGTAEYVMQATLGGTTLSLHFGHAEVADLFVPHLGIGRAAEIVLVGEDGRFLTPLRHVQGDPVGQVGARPEQCRANAGALIGADHRGVESFQSFRPVGALGGACVIASVGYDGALAPAEQLRADLMHQGALFMLVGAVLSLGAARWIASPVRRLARSARTLQTGQFDRPIPLAGPSEVRDLGRAFNAMANDLAELVAREQGARRDAEDANRSKDEFLARVSHELRTPLTAVLGWAQMLRSGQLSPDRVRHGIAVIERNARAQSQLIDDLLDVSRIVSNRLRISREPVRLAEVVEAALDAVRPQADAKQVELETDLNDDALVLGDQRRLEQVVWNLAWNAVKFTEPSGRVMVQLTREDRNLVLSVADTGIGISSAFLPHVFEWFRQADATSRSQAGLGLGLGIVRHIVQLHNGSVRAESRGVGQGATFTVALPIHEPAVAFTPAPSQLAALPQPIAPRLAAARVLVVEDDEDTREVVRATLEKAGASVEVVATAASARQELLADTPDVLISDIRMPEEDGYSLIRSLRRAGMTTPAIALTAYARREDADEARAAGFQVHIAKPVDARLLVEAVATLLERQGVH